MIAKTLGGEGKWDVRAVAAERWSQSLLVLLLSFYTEWIFPPRLYWTFFF